MKSCVIIVVWLVIHCLAIATEMFTDILKPFFLQMNAGKVMFQVMMQKHNRHMSFSLYISMLAVTDTICLLIGKFFY